MLRSRFATTPFEAEVLDHTGQPLSRIPLVTIAGYTGDTHRFYPHDVDDDGNDELVFWNREAVVAARADSSNEILWRRLIATRLNAVLEGLLPGSSDSTSPSVPTVAVLRQGNGDNSLIGVDVADGDIRWICAGPTARSGGGWIVPKRIELLGRIADTPPQVFFEFTGLSVCRQAADTTVAVNAEVTTSSGDRTDVCWKASQKCYARQRSCVRIRKTRGTSVTSLAAPLGRPRRSTDDYGSAN